jgi:DNA polymerase III epsilon subunit-like protein
VETTGLFPDKCQIIELACLYEEYNEDTGNTINKGVFHAYCLPEERPKDFDRITEITGITYEYLQENGISEKELFDRLITFLNEKIDRYNKEDKAYFVAYKAEFDNQFIRELFNRHSNDKVYFGNYFYHLCLDSLQLALFCEFFGLFDRPENFKLETLVKHLKLVDENKNNFHSALVDIKETRKLSNYLKDKLIKEWGQQKNVS